MGNSVGGGVGGIIGSCFGDSVYQAGMVAPIKNGPTLTI
jgi:hypothetical protein